MSGLLSEQFGGKSVKPYQPDGIWEAVAFVGSTTQYYKRDAGEALVSPQSVYVLETNCTAAVVDGLRCSVA
jgi:hypothetical protein